MAMARRSASTRTRSGRPLSGRWYGLSATVPLLAGRECWSPAWREGQGGLGRDDPQISSA